MKRPLVLTERAVDDMTGVVDRYRDEAPELVQDLLERFADLMVQIERTPGAGSLRYQDRLSVAGLRHRTAGKFPYLVFYVSRGPHVVVLRILHQHRDLESAFDD